MLSRQVRLGVQLVPDGLASSYPVSQANQASFTIFILLFQFPERILTNKLLKHKCLEVSGLMSFVFTRQTRYKLSQGSGEEETGKGMGQGMGTADRLLTHDFCHGRLRLTGVEPACHE